MEATQSLGLGRRFLQVFHHVFPAFRWPHAFSQVITQSGPSCAAEYWVVGPCVRGTTATWGEPAVGPQEVRAEECAFHGLLQYT